MTTGARRDPSDAEIEDVLRRASAAQWAALASAAHALARETEYMTWGGGEQVDTTVIDGVERPVIQMPYAIYTDAVDQLLAALGGLGTVVPFNWSTWDGIVRYRGATALDTAPVADAVRMTTAIIRAERFSEGGIGETLADGTLLAAVRRLLRWHAEKAEG
jgi:hypothetical protein